MRYPTPRHALYVVLIFLLTALPPGTSFAGSFSRPVDHKLAIHMQPERGFMRVEDTLTFYPQDIPGNSMVFHLHGGFELEEVEIPHKGKWNVHIATLKKDQDHRIRIEVTSPPETVWPDFLEIRFRYKGTYRDLQAPVTPDPDTAHTVVLAGESHFYPVMETDGPGPLLTFSLETVTSPGWRVVSQGKRVSQTTGDGRIATTWKCDDPMEEIFLITDRYFEFEERMSDVTLRVFLRQNEPELAARYLKAARGYIRFFEKMLGPYPFVKFAVVENSEQTGYGMPSFTLLGSQIIRFPFILHTSYPHEILHNWWGNGVYLDPASGNWSEGLTAYLADHLLPELSGKGAEYRFQELMKYLNYVTPDNDFPLTAFTSRNDMASQAIGYGKWLMVLHMLRQKLGHEHFLEGLHGFYFDNTFKRAGFDTLRMALEEIAGEHLKPFFQQWVERSGAPLLKLTEAEFRPEGSGFQLTLSIEQQQEDAVFELDVPLAVWQVGSEVAHLETVHLTQKRQTFTLPLPRKPTAVQLDPYYDVFRKLNRDEVPPSIGQTYGADPVAALLPESTPPELLKAYQTFAKNLGAVPVPPGNDQWETIPQKAVWLFGRDSPATRALLPWLSQHGVTLTDDAITVNGKTFSWNTHSVALTLPHPEDPARSVTWLVASSPTAIAGLIRKLPHYGKYGYLVFEGDAPTNVAKGLWSAQGTSVLKRFDDGKFVLSLPERPPLVAFSPEIR